MTGKEILQIEGCLKQEQMICSSFANGDGPWTIICDNWNDGNGCYGGHYIALSRPELRSRILSNMGWDLTKGHGVPGFMVSGTDTEYFRNDGAPDFEPLVIFQEFHDVVPDAILISEEFRLLMSLWFDSESGNYFQIGDDGSKNLTIKIDGHKVEVRTPVLKHYLAARQLDATLFFDSIVSVPTAESSEAFMHLSIEDSSNNRDKCLSRYIGELRRSSYEKKVFSRVLAKRILLAPPRETCGIWPWDKIEAEDYPNFIIGENEIGKPIRFTCNPDQLANYFGANPDAPHYLTPVFFKPEVLQKYYDDSSLYEVCDGYLSCAHKWRVQIDNDDPEFVAVFLGDIGRDIPQSHWDHWLSHNVPPIQKMSETNILRSFFGQFVDSKNSEHRFKLLYKELNRVWKQCWGWPLYREAKGQDAGVLRRLRIPVNDTDTELRAQLLNLALVLVDLLNEKGITERLSEKIKNEKGIDKLQRFLETSSYEHVDRDISLLKKIQRMRSRIAAHASGTSGQELLENELSGQSPQEYIQHLLAEAAQMMDDLIGFAKQSAPGARSSNVTRSAPTSTERY